MKPMCASVCSVSCVLAAGLCFSHLTIATAAAPAVKAFPTAEGFGADAGNNLLFYGTAELGVLDVIVVRAMTP